MKTPILYMFPACPFCQRVMSFAAMQNIELEYRDVRENPEFRQELIELSGETQVPFLVDEEQGLAMPESGDIIAYLEEKYVK